ncbi:probable inactive DNA (cytosine-5)-methyltransferase DRM3 [Phalaenopsis equestris]|uniref:probable inactive DNA (cytosine-5)-methyltransferase DRM3 n=1 Tax=Phalaenopsis equestris TaxID=78828 RepID=UPI0009E1C260|nr:probable inactive DNA (cytosine-5)-methyltransferase DRM3 [Phalaenopsis equestris]XP_020576950.1 probable inactive DNA (cytosine-5)-methyltransferase DRM3 [Phalaenopsis equestris]XP_020576951.1 probable inactive DNA (cytosine-5)-methyltransferase DRM3 [Phalaenopsis equestris]XP_020576952.1 probable inactive DNA (cytosine-5)-methyltransferase DRM3 [Phalaenopsis equestris]
MVKLEDGTNSDGAPNGEAGVDSSIDAGSSGLIRPCSVPVVVKEESLPSSSCSHFKSYLVGMGFSSILVDKVIEENGEDDVNILLEALLAQSVHSKSSPASVSLSEYSRTIKEEESSFEFLSDDYLDEKDDDSDSHIDMEKRSYLLMMDFTQKEIDLAITRLGESSSLAELVDFIIASQNGGSYENKGMLGSVTNDNEDEASTTEALFGTMDRTLYLLRMGFTENEVSSAIANFGSDASLEKLADSILASRLASQVKQEDFSNDDIYFSPEELKEFEQLGSVKEENPVDYSFVPQSRLNNTSHSNSTSDDYEDNRIQKKPKFVHADGSGTSWSQCQDAERFQFPSTGRGRNTDYPELHGTTEAASVKKELPDHVPRNLSGRFQNMDSKSPFFFYGNVADVSQDTWRKLSQFLHGTQPQFVNTQFFSALIRKEGYLHNLPTEGRFHINPKSPMTIEDALPHTKKWWPSWDTRKHVACINSETVGVSELCDRLGSVMGSSQGMISKEQQMDIFHHCKAMNLIWIGPNKLCPMEPEHLEQILGYPRHHTDIWDLELPGRLNALKYSFQTDTIGYHLSVLKSIYPDGLRLLSICSVIGGAEVALYRLGIRLRCVVSIEASESNRKILKQWWNNTGQSGELRQIAGVEKLTIRQIEGLIKEFGGFDVIVGGNPGFLPTSGSSRDSLVGMDLNHFYEFTRVLQRVRSVMGRIPASAGRRN